ncbi:WhiB family transcriptional regulator [Spongiactinospora rosea]|nr:WhiB family transcriptional regulator [Spongiactinospora rosea]
MSLPQLEAAWTAAGDVPLPECVYDPDLHTGPRGVIEPPGDRAAREAVAREVCAACPALEVCGRYAARVRPTSGIWAGRTPTELAEHTARLSHSGTLPGDLPGLGVA